MLYQHFVTSWHLVLSCSVPKGSAKKKQRKNTAYKKNPMMVKKKEDQ